MGNIASPLDEEAEAEARPLGRCESGTRTGLCRLIWRFFCDFPMFYQCRGINVKWKNEEIEELDVTAWSAIVQEADQRALSFIGAYDKIVGVWV